MHLLSAQLVKALRVRCMSLYSSCVYSIIIRLEMRPAVHCVLNTHNNKIYLCVV